MPDAPTVMERIAALARISEHPHYLLRRSYTDAMREANSAVAAWMEACGMQTRIDATGNLVGRYAAADPDAPTFIFGSHLDTVRDAGAYDGPLGILLALAAVERLAQQGTRLPFHVEIIAFSDEEGLRWGTTYLGSRAVAGIFDPADLQRADADDIRLADAMRDWGAEPDRIILDHRDPARVLGYCEAHIEQGPVLEAQDLPVGVVTAIAGQSRFTLAVRGVAGHAGTVPMTLRRDALCAAADFVLQTEAYARATPGLVATVGHIGVEPGVSNVIAGHVTITLDVRHADDDVREEACRALHERMQVIARQRGVVVRSQTVQEISAVACDARLSALVARAIADTGCEPFALPSGAGHDTAAMAALTPVAMLFVRCAGGISHNPAERVDERDVAVAIDVLERFLGLLATGQGANA